MGQKEQEPGKFRLSRRDFLKVSAAGAAAAGGALEMSFGAPQALAYDEPVTISTTTCPYCSASCGQKVVVGQTSGKVLDIYGDDESPFNRGGLCAKGAGGFQLATNSRRIGYATHPDNPTFSYNATYGTNGVAYRRYGNGAWEAMALDTAMGEIAQKMLDARDATGVTGGTGAPSASNYFNSNQIAFFGSSHINNEQNNLYRKIVANFGTTNVEHQARI